MNELTQKILNHSFEYAKDLLIDTGQCYPFGAFVDSAEIVHPLEFEITDKKNIPNNESVIWSLNKFCEAELKENKIIAYGLTHEAIVQLEENKPGIETIAIDIVNEQDTDIPIYYYPYTSDKEGNIEIGEPFAVVR